MNNRKIRVLVADDHIVVREGICALLALAEDIEVVGEASNGQEAIGKTEKCRPDVVLIDMAMPVMGGLEATRRICRDYPATKVLILTQYDEKEYVFPVIDAGASGFISKAGASQELVDGIHAVHRGDSYLSPPIARLLVDSYRHAGLNAAQDTYDQLTDREREVLKLVAEGYTTQEIAGMLVLSAKTVEGHRTNLMSKLGLNNRIDLVKYALRKGIITL